MRTRTWTVLVDWVSNGCEDSDEIRVRAASAADAKRKALWRFVMRTNGAEIGVTKVFILTEKLVRKWCD